MKIKKMKLTLLVAFVFFMVTVMQLSVKASTAESNITVYYRTHIQSFGWDGQVNNLSTWRVDGEMSGTYGLSKRLEGIEIQVSGADNLSIQYTTHCQTYGWLPWSADGEMNGTSGEAKRLEAIKIKLTGTDSDRYDVFYRVHAQSYGWLSWAKNGQAAGTAGLAKRLEGIQVVVLPKGETPSNEYKGIKAENDKAYVSVNGTLDEEVSGADKTNVLYKTHVQTFGWQGWRYNGKMSGTSGLAKRLEGIEIKLSNKQYDGGITYRTHVQTYGWQEWVVNGEMSGTSGEAKRLESIQIYLTGDMAKHYDLYYRVHAQSYGWLGWAKNGEPAGTAGFGKRLEGIQIVLMNKNTGAPGNLDGINSVTEKGFQYKSVEQIPENPYVEPSGENESGNSGNTENNQGTSGNDGKNNEATEDVTTEEQLPDSTTTEESTAEDKLKESAIKKAKEYTYEIIPMLENTNLYFYVKTEDPDVSDMYFVDEDSAYAVRDYVKVKIGQDTTNYADVKYENIETKRVMGGYIFYGAITLDETDGGEWVIYCEDSEGKKMHNTGVTVQCPPVVSEAQWALNKVTNDSMKPHEKLRAVQTYLNENSSYPKTVIDTTRVNEDKPYPFFSPLSWPEYEGYIFPEYGRMYEGTGMGLLSTSMNPFDLSSAGTPGFMRKVARIVDPDCIVENHETYHELIKVTIDGKTETYGGSGYGKADAIYKDCVDIVFLFDGSESDFAKNVTVEKLYQQYLKYDADSLIIQNTYKAWLYDGYDEKVAQYGWTRMGYGKTNDILTYYECPKLCPKGRWFDVWVEGRYIGTWMEGLKLGERYEDHPTSDIILEDITYINAAGDKVTTDVIYVYNEEYKQWYGEMAYECADYSPGRWTSYTFELEDLPEELVLTQAEVDAMVLDYNTNTYPEKYLIYDGTAKPGTIGLN